MLSISLPCLKYTVERNILPSFISPYMCCAYYLRQDMLLTVFRQFISISLIRYIIGGKLFIVCWHRGIYWGYSTTCTLIYKYILFYFLYMCRIVDYLYRMENYEKGMFAVMLRQSTKENPLKKTCFSFSVQYTWKCINFTHLNHKPIKLCMIYSKWKKILLGINHRGHVITLKRK